MAEEPPAAGTEPGDGRSSDVGDGPDGTRETTRREAVLAGTTGLGALLAGCLSGESGDPEPSNETEDPFDVDVPVETRQAGATFSEPAWAEEGDGSGVAYLYGEEPERLFEGLREREPAADEFVAQTDFGSSVLLQLGSVGPDACYDGLALEELDIDGSTLSGAASVTRSSPSREGCGETVTYPWLLARVGASISTATMTITDGGGEASTVSTDRQERIDPAELGGFVSPGGEPPATPAPLECGTGSRHEQRVDEADVQLGQATREGEAVFALGIDDTTYEHGDRLGVSLRNLAATPRESAGRYSYNLQVLTAAGWEDVRVVTGGGISYPDSRVVHAPGEGFDWSISLEESDILDGHILEPSLFVCSSLETGRYRFLFWDPAVAVEFDYIA